MFTLHLVTASRISGQHRQRHRLRRRNATGVLDARGTGHTLDTDKLAVATVSVVQRCIAGIVVMRLRQRYISGL